jgi:molecular chaperone GrpE
MMKKKVKEQEEPKEEYINKTADNKEHSRQTGSDNSSTPENSVKVENGSQWSGTANPESQVADKAAAEVRSLEEKLAEQQDRYIRLSAEFDNYRKRTLREKIELSKYASEELFRKIIPIMDDFDRALAHMDSASDSKAMKEGIDIIYNKFSEFLKQNGIKEIESMNISFNVDLHDAIAKVPVQEEEKKGKVVDVVQKGYYLQDKVLRHSKVVVGE